MNSIEYKGDPFRFKTDYEIVEEHINQKVDEQTRHLLTENIKMNEESISGVLIKKSDNEPRFAKIVYRKGTLEFRVNEEDV